MAKLKGFTITVTYKKVFRYAGTSKREILESLKEGLYYESSRDVVKGLKYEVTERNPTPAEIKEAKELGIIR